MINVPCLAVVSPHHVYNDPIISFHDGFSSFYKFRIYLERLKIPPEQIEDKLEKIKSEILKFQSS